MSMTETKEDRIGVKKLTIEFLDGTTMEIDGHGIATFSIQHIYDYQQERDHAGIMQQKTKHRSTAKIDIEMKYWDNNMKVATNAKSD